MSSLLVSFGSLEIIYQAGGGIAGRHVEIRDGSVYVNGKRLSEPYIPPESADWEPGSHPHPGGRIFRHGRSSDQLEWIPESSGPCLDNLFIGKAVFAYWPVDHFGSIPVFVESEK